MTNKWVDFAAVKQAVPILAVLQHYQVKGLKRCGAELRGRCPIHRGDSEDAFHVNVEKNCFQCFAGSCRKRGNVLDLVAAMEGCSVRDAALRLQDWFGVTGSDTGTVRNSNEPVAGRDGGVEVVVNPPLKFQLQGIDCKHAYLMSTRGFSQQTTEDFGVGFFPGKGSMSGRVVIPICNEAGELVAYAGRALDGAEPRYKLPAGFRKSAVLFNLHRAIATGERGLIVVEGFFDALRVHEAGFPFVVAMMGCVMSEEQERLLVAHADMVLVMLDGDEAGRKGTDDILLRLGRRVWVKSVEVPEGLQPDQMSSGHLREVLRS